MPRINIEERWNTDPRRLFLISKLGNQIADGAALQLWSLAQQYFREDQLIPIHVFRLIPNHALLAESGLAEIQDEWVYVKGVKEHFNWLFERKKHGQAGGFAKEASKRYQTLANASKRWQTLPSSSSSSSKKERIHTRCGLFELWENKRGALPAVKEISPEREKLAQKQWLSNPDPEYWSQIFSTAAASPFCLGHTGGTFVANFDWLIKPANRAKVLEGNFSGPRKTKSPISPQFGIFGDETPVTEVL